jgi:amidase
MLRPTSHKHLWYDFIVSSNAILDFDWRHFQTADSDNNVFGRTLNPYKLTLTAGGSSGGEGALVALGGSILGVGTDIGGSIRIPAYCNGIYGFKPSANRIPYGGQQPAGRFGSPGIIAAAGPLTRSVRDLEFFTKSVIDAEPQDYDSSALAVPWISAPLKIKLVIGVLAEDPDFPLLPPVKRTLETAIEKLQAASHTIIPLTDAPGTREANEIAVSLFQLDPTKSAVKKILASGEPFVQSVLKGAADFAAYQAASEKPPLFPLPADGYTLENLWDLNAARADYSERWNQALVKAKIDVIIGPVAETTAPPHDTYGNSPYTIIWNLLNVSPYISAT